MLFCGEAPEMSSRGLDARTREPCAGISWLPTSFSQSCLLKAGQRSGSGSGIWRAAQELIRIQFLAQGPFSREQRAFSELRWKAAEGQTGTNLLPAIEYTVHITCFHGNVTWEAAPRSLSLCQESGNCFLVAVCAERYQSRTGRQVLASAGSQRWVLFLPRRPALRFIKDALSCQSVQLCTLQGRLVFVVIVRFSLGFCENVSDFHQKTASLNCLSLY